MIQTNLAYTSDNPKLDYRVIIKKILNGNLAYIFGRFYICRKAYSQYRKIQQLFQSDSGKKVTPSQINNLSQVPQKKIVNDINRYSYYDQLELDRESVISIREAAKTKSLSANNLSFTYKDYFTKTKLHHKIAMAHVKEPLKIDVVNKLRYDSYLLEIASQYLQYFPTNCDVKLWWSFADNLSLEERRSQCQTIDYHYDIHGLNFFYVSFYLTDVDIDSGAHVLVKGTHANKKISMLLRSARVPEEMINKYYSTQDIITIKGKAGKCFLEDASCFHKALSPTKKDRLFLQLRYY